MKWTVDLSRCRQLQTAFVSLSAYSDAPMCLTQAKFPFLGVVNGYESLTSSAHTTPSPSSTVHVAQAFCLFFPCEMHIVSHVLYLMLVN